MSNWVTEHTIFFLLLGLVPLGYVVGRAALGNVSQSVTLRFWGVLFIWAGYHLSPWLSYLFHADWYSPLLVDHYIDDGLFFSAGCMFAYLVGYEGLIRKLPETGHNPEGKEVVLPQVQLATLLFIALLCAILFVVEVGGLAEVWESSRPRGESQWDEREGLLKILRMVSVLGVFLRVGLACLASLFAMDSSQPLLQRLVWGIICLWVAGLGECYSFSRGAGYPFTVLAILALYLKGRKGLGVAALGFGLTVYLASVGFSQRENYRPGLGTYITALTSPATMDSSSSNPLLSVEANPLNAMDAWTRKVEAVEFEAPELRVVAPHFFWNLNPLPSELVPLIPLGASLEEIMGTVGVVGLTTPALAELYYVFGLWGVLFVAALGIAYAWFDRIRLSHPGVLSSVCFLLCTVSFPLGLHSSMRVMTRPLIYALVCWLLGNWYLRNCRTQPAGSLRSMVSRGPAHAKS